MSAVLGYNVADGSMMLARGLALTVAAVLSLRGFPLLRSHPRDARFVSRVPVHGILLHYCTLLLDRCDRRSTGFGRSRPLPWLEACAHLSLAGWCLVETLRYVMMWNLVGPSSRDEAHDLVERQLRAVRCGRGRLDWGRRGRGGCAVTRCFGLYSRSRMRLGFRRRGRSGHLGGDSETILSSRPDSSAGAEVGRRRFRRRCQSRSGECRCAGTRRVETHLRRNQRRLGRVRGRGSGRWVAQGWARRARTGHGDACAGDGDTALAVGVEPLRKC